MSKSLKDVSRFTASFSQSEPGSAAGAGEAHVGLRQAEGRRAGEGRKAPEAHVGIQLHSIDQCVCVCVKAHVCVCCVQTAD